MFRHSLIAIVALAAMSCDTDEVCGSDRLHEGRLVIAEPVLPDPEFRKSGDLWYIGVPNAMPLAQALKMAATCPTLPVFYSISGYMPDITKADEYLVGIGFSTVDSKATFDCMQDVAYKAGGVKL